MAKGVCGYGRYDDDPQIVGCPRAKSDMSPCLARDGRIALWDSTEQHSQCVGCSADPFDLMVELKREAKLTAPSASQRAAHHADQLQKLVRKLTKPTLTSPAERSGADE
jgi:hypothetical protein